MTPRPILKCIVVYFILFLISLAFPNISFANFSDDFSNLANWSTFANNGTITNNTGSLVLSAPTGYTYPYIFLTSSTIPDNNYDLEVKFKLSGQLTYGSGIVFSDHIISNGTSTDVGWDDFIFNIWPTSSGTYKVFSNPCPENSTCAQDSYKGDISSFTDNDWHIMSIHYSDGIYELHIDGNKTFKSSLSNKKISQIWIGNPQHTAQQQLWPIIEVSYLKIQTSDPVVTPTPTPSPSPTPAPTLKPIILLPGLGASWDYDAILHNTNSNNWQIPTWITNYNNLLLSLEKVGYQRDKNLFVFGYDWRKPILTLADDLNAYINGLISQDTFKNTDKVVLIGHSMGGLVARAYGQKHGTDSIDQIITAGTPHEGALQSYPAWEGAQIRGFNWYQRAALQLLLLASKRPTETPVDEIRRIVPSTRDMLPTFDYLSQNGKFKSVTALSEQNLILTYLNDNSFRVKPLVNSIFGTGMETLANIDVTNRSWIDTIFHRWEDGKPLNYLNNYQGDGTIQKRSALSDFYNLAELDQNHSGVIESSQAISAIFDSLELDKSQIISNTTSLNTDKVFIAYLHSPGQIQIINSNNQSIGVTSPDQKFAMIPDLVDGNYSIKLFSNGESGKYTLSIGMFDDQHEDWQNFTGQINTGETKQYPVNIISGQAKLDTQKVHFESLISDSLLSLRDRSIQEHLRQIKGTNLPFIKSIHLFNIKLKLHDLYVYDIKTKHFEDAENIKNITVLIDKWLIELKTKTTNQSLTGGKIKPVQALKNVCELRTRMTKSLINAQIYEYAGSILSESSLNLNTAQSQIWLDSAFLWYKDCAEI